MRSLFPLGLAITLASSMGCGAAAPPSDKAPAPPAVEAAPMAVPQPSAPSPEAAPPAATPPPPASPPSPELPRSFDAPPLPAAFFDAHADLEKLFPERAKLIGADAATPAPRPSEGAASRRAMLWPTPVIQAEDPIYRLACSTRSLRIALYVPGDALATVARRVTTLLPTATAKAPRGVPETGVLLAAGARLRVPEATPPSGERVLVRFRGLFLEAAAFAEVDALGKAFLPGELPADPILNGELTENVSVLDSPGGTPFARIAKDAGVANRLLVHTLGPVKKGHRRIRYEDGDAAVYGWVDAAQVKDIPRLDGGIGGGASGYGTGGPNNALSLPAGTRLRAPTAAPGTAIGMLVQDTELECLEGCTGDAPHVRVHACGSDVEVVVVRSGAAVR